MIKWQYIAVWLGTTQSVGEEDRQSPIVHLQFYIQPRHKHKKKQVPTYD